ncbi:hypothetical protein [Mongoliibacter ruber]|uniref:Uncharacterized protein n=1 Tax=Mongoliibacter ruber TaxID=1750599 RepID=A0A2T0WLB8_9BACT|nr:hypothetical protein [Mongoliibacter ruber]PRY87500.1 hypothetical protein CLW00_106124 [Mongoliibacter ruber]
MKYLVSLLFLFGSFYMFISPLTSFSQTDDSNVDDEFIEYQNKSIPVEIAEATIEALSYFPELEDVSIDFVYREKIKGAVMQAQPYLFSLFVNGKNSRRYKIKVTRQLEFAEGYYPIEQVPYDALVGWIGHELGHVMDYLNRSSANMMHFGARYFLSNKRVIEAELTADGYAIGCGMGHHILANKNYILNNENFEDDYKDKIKNLYMSPDQILTLQKVLDDKVERQN